MNTKRDFRAAICVPGLNSLRKAAERNSREPLTDEEWNAPRDMQQRETVVYIYDIYIDKLRKRGLPI